MSISEVDGVATSELGVGAASEVEGSRRWRYLPRTVESGLTWRNLAVVRRTAVALWLVCVCLSLWHNGIAYDRTTLLIYMCSGLLVASIGRRKFWTVFVDWLPFAAILYLYDMTRGVAEWMGMPTHWTLAPDFDRGLFGQVPTVWLQGELKQVSPPWWEIGTSTIYISFFVVPYVVAGVLWLRNRRVWARYAVCFVAMSFLALVGYTLVPGAPPWAAAKCAAVEVADHPRDPACIYGPGPRADGGLLGVADHAQPGSSPLVERISGRGWQVLHLRSAESMLQVGQAKSNLVAAIPSLHAGLTMMLALFMWPRVKALGRTLFVGYALAMAFTLVYTGEHYVFDVLLGWGLAAVVVGSVAYVDRLLSRRRAQRSCSDAG
ncbi:phosphatase PAP2 family protein [Gordonia jinhuaensis]|uniref:Phosphatidic acid phosphatase n=1 Tax=Gordonia jinhuaensis TaxID=1517702 RepID=A0A916WZM0_9ACTN|nr:phosphatidic acid phosphatase [Gordonia jinhuaensis]